MDVGKDAEACEAFQEAIKASPGAAKVSRRVNLSSPSPSTHIGWSRDINVARPICRDRGDMTSVMLADMALRPALAFCKT